MNGTGGNTPGRWGDLPARVGSAAVMLTVGATAIWAGGMWFQVLVAVIGGGMIWEFSRLMGPDKQRFAVPMGLLAAVALASTAVLPAQAIFPVLLAVAIAGATQLEKDRLVYGLYAAALILACFGLIVIRETRGAYWIVWLVSVVVVTDVAGYFAGKLLGGPKFWPSVSPKKTWSGTVAGWIAAAGVGMVFGGVPLIVLSVMTSFSSQMGDAAESALKRRAGIKDSSNLIPGHGGLLDRFDAMLGAALFVLLMGAALGLPAV